MASGTNYLQEYEQAEKAYQEGNFPHAAEIIDRLAEEFDDNPNVLLLKGHIHFAGFQNYQLAKEQYQLVLALNPEQEIAECAQDGIVQVEQVSQSQPYDLDIDSEEESQADWLDDLDGDMSDITQYPDMTAFPESNVNAVSMVSSDLTEFNFDEPDQQSLDLEDVEVDDVDLDSSVGDSELDNDFSSLEDDYEDPFSDFDYTQNLAPSESDSLPSAEDVADSNSVHNSSTFMVEADDEDEYLSDDSSFDFGDSVLLDSSEGQFEDFTAQTDMNFVSEATEPALDNNELEYEYEYDSEDTENNFVASAGGEVDGAPTEPYSIDNTEPYAIDNSEGFNFSESSEHDGLDYQDDLEFDDIDSSFFDLEELEQGLPDTGLFNVAEDLSDINSGVQTGSDLDESGLVGGLEEDYAVEGSSNSVTADLDVEPVVEVPQGLLGGLANATMPKKQLINACFTGLVSAIAVFGVGVVGSTVLADESAEQSPLIGVRNSGLLSLVAGVASFGTSMFFGSLISKQMNRSTTNLQSQFNDVYQGNLNAKATVYSQDEFGKLATSFNRMTRVILTTTQEAQRRAEETEQAKEDLQRQVIRLLDDVEGAARGDLTVQATVTADVLGAVADAFNLTIQSLREIVRQVKEAAKQVNQSSTDSEVFARNQSSEALKMAEELAVTLNSVQMMTESIERVAENAREAEEVARSSSVTALKGGKAVESTVAGIFQIRETVSETARKVKRLAEASQEISKIVLLISQIAERTNQLALNASIQAAKAGEAGRGFAVVADEVRQLADRSGKSLKEIEQIVLQIQSETGSVMTAMEEGIQEVIDVTDRAEQAKTALEDIIQVSNRIDTLVRTITADTVEQRENSRAVAQVMQSVELTAQGTSQESQQVAGSLQSLVSIARDLQSSVERFRIDRSAS